MPTKPREKHLYDLSHPIQARPPTTHARPPGDHAWDIDKPDGSQETIDADFCILTHNGALSFYRKLPLPNDSVLIRAISPGKWVDVHLSTSARISSPDPCA